MKKVPNLKKNLPFFVFHTKNVISHVQIMKTAEKNKI